MSICLISDDNIKENKTKQNKKKAVQPRGAEKNNSCMDNKFKSPYLFVNITVYESHSVWVDVDPTICVRFWYALSLNSWILFFFVFFSRICLSLNVHKSLRGRTSSLSSNSWMLCGVSHSTRHIHFSFNDGKFVCGWLHWLQNKANMNAIQIRCVGKFARHHCYFSALAIHTTDITPHMYTFF